MCLAGANMSNSTVTSCDGRSQNHNGLYIPERMQPRLPRQRRSLARLQYGQRRDRPSCKYAPTVSRIKSESTALACVHDWLLNGAGM
jgi:hypothetical protein